MIKLPDDFSEIRIKKARLWIDRVMLDSPGMKEAKTCAAILDFIDEAQRLNATAQHVSDGSDIARKVLDALRRHGLQEEFARIAYEVVLDSYPAAPGGHDD